MQEKHKKIWKNARVLAYMDFFLYLCARFWLLWPIVYELINKIYRNYGK